MRRALAILAVGAVCALGCGPSGSPDAGEEVAAEERPVPPLDPEAVPAGLRSLVPLAQEWGIGDDVDRYEKVQSASPQERAAFLAQLSPHQQAITAWLDSFPDGEMSDEAAAFMFMQLAGEEMGND